MSNKDAPFLIGIFLSVVAWSVSSLISEIDQRKLVQYELSKRVESDHRVFVARITNLSGREPIDGAFFHIAPAANTTLLETKGKPGRIRLSSLVHLQAKTRGSVEKGALFELPLIPPGAFFDLIASYKTDDPSPNLAAYFQNPAGTTTGTQRIDPKMKLVSACSLEAILVRNQIRIYLGLLLIAFLVVAVWTVRVWREG